MPLIAHLAPPRKTAQKFGERRCHPKNRRKLPRPHPRLLTFHQDWRTTCRQHLPGSSLPCLVERAGSLRTLLSARPPSFSRALLAISKMASLEAAAYLKLVGHCFRHPHAAVNGVLVGTVGDGGRVVATDCYPLFHQHLGLAPMLEAALLQIDEKCRKTGQQIVGYYHGNAHSDHVSPR